MATFDWPPAVYPSGMTWGNRKAGTSFQSPYTGSTQAIEFPAERWIVSLTLAGAKWKNSAFAEAFFARLAGGVNRVRLYHMVRPRPQGTMRGLPTVAVAAGRGDVALSINTGQPGSTMRAGDLASVGAQLLMAADDATANGAGLLVMPLVHRVRGPVPVGSAVLWDRPTAEFTMPAMSSSLTYAAVVSQGMSVDLEEAW